LLVKSVKNRKMILSQMIGNYSQTIRVNNSGNEVVVKRNGKTLYDGYAGHIIDTNNLLTFNDKNGEPHEYVKYPTYRLT
jgi:hypothetical protein